MLARETCKHWRQKIRRDGRNRSNDYSSFFRTRQLLNFGSCLADLSEDGLRPEEERPSKLS
jgi:hypothetical protein